MATSASRAGASDPSIASTGLSSCNATTATRGRRSAQRAVELPHQCLHALGVVRAVEQDGRSPGDQLEAAGWHRSGERSLGRLAVQRARRQQQLGETQREGGVVAQVGGGQRQAVPRPRGDALAARARLLRQCGCVRVETVVHDADAERCAGLEHGELLGQDQLPRVAEHALVVEADVREPDDARVDDARGVVPAAETRLDDAGLDTGLGQHQERSRRESLELRGTLAERGLDGARRLLHAIERDRERGGADGRPSICTRSSQPTTCGERYAPVRSPDAVSAAAAKRTVDDLPFVPTT